VTTFWRAFLLGAMSGLMGRHLAVYALWEMLDRQLAGSAPRRGGRRRRHNHIGEPEP
jgi:hypothetical protein